MKKLFLIMFIIGCSGSPEPSSENLDNLAKEKKKEVDKANRLSCDMEETVCNSRLLAYEIREIAYLVAVGNCWKTGASLTHSEENKEKRLEYLYYIRDCYVEAYEEILEKPREEQEENGNN